MSLASATDAGGFSITKKREPWSVRYLYTPRPPMLRTLIDIEEDRPFAVVPGELSIEEWQVTYCPQAALEDKSLGE
jgi:hypothetical protein